MPCVESLPKPNQDAYCQISNLVSKFATSYLYVLSMSFKLIHLAATNSQTVYFDKSVHLTDHQVIHRFAMQHKRQISTIMDFILLSDKGILQHHICNQGVW